MLADFIVDALQADSQGGSGSRLVARKSAEGGCDKGSFCFGKRWERRCFIAEVCNRPGERWGSDRGDELGADFSAVVYEGGRPEHRVAEFTDVAGPRITQEDVQRWDGKADILRAFQFNDGGFEEIEGKGRNFVLSVAQGRKM